MINKQTITEMESKIGRKILESETLIYINNPKTGVTNAYHRIVTKWEEPFFLRMRGDA